jgi:glycosyltransferase involved in cell wall biosynthesis
MTRKAVVVHAGRRDNYQVALALQEAGLLEKLVTDVYLPGEKEVVQRLFSAVNKSEVLRLRYMKGLPSDKVSLSLKSIWLEGRLKIAKDNGLSAYKDAVLGSKARKLAENTDSALLSYSTYAKEAFQTNVVKNRFLFQLHPHPLFVQNILKEELALTPSAAESLLKEYEMSLPAQELERLIEEPLLANGWMAASSFTARSLAKNGSDLSKIHVIPYGIDAGRYSAKQQYKNTGKLNVLFIGSFNQRKGLSYLLEAIRLVGPKKVKLTLVGRGIMDNRLLSLYNDLDIQTRVNISHAQLVQEAHDADVLVLPSIAEGFAQVILEAMSCGLPVITTENTAGPDILTNGKDGYVIPIRNPVSIAEKLSLFIEKKYMAEEMGRAAVITASRFTWEKFRSGVVKAYKEMLLVNNT